IRRDGRGRRRERHGEHGAARHRGGAGLGDQGAAAREVHHGQTEAEIREARARDGEAGGRGRGGDGAGGGGGGAGGRGRVRGACEGAGGDAGAAGSRRRGGALEIAAVGREAHIRGEDARGGRP